MGYAHFVHLRNHTAYSLAEGALKVSNIISLCQKYNMPAVAITDTNNIFGGAEFSEYLAKDGIQPILGTQISVDFDLPSSAFLKDKYAELVLLVQNDVGYHNLLKLLSYAYLKKEAIDPPHITFDMLKEKSEGLIALSGGIKGVIGKALLANNKQLAEEKCLELKNLFKDRFYIEIQRHNIPDEIQTEGDFLNLAYKHNIPLVATNECYFSTRDMYQAHDVLLCITEGKYIDEQDRRHETEEHYFKSPDEMIELFSDLPEAINNTLEIAKRCAYKFKNTNPLLPHIAKGADEPTLLRELSYKGLVERLDKAGIIDEAERKPYFDRLEYELDTIISMKFPGYFLIVADFIGWAKEHGIPVGPGRGSGAGSIVAWAMKITNLNPLRFGLLFERFLNPERVNMPDFDIDFCQDRRGEVIHYIQNKYGFDSVGQIITFGKLQTKNVIKDVGRVLRIPYTKCDELCKMIPNKLYEEVVNENGEKDSKDIAITVPNCFNYIPEFKNAVENDDMLKGLISIAMKLEGLYRNVGTHAAGVVIGDRPIDELVALYKDDKSDMPVTQYNMKFIEKTGLIKYDFLGLKTLTVIKKTCDMILKNKGVSIDIDNIPMDDKKTYDMIMTANTPGIFQLESKGMQSVILSMKPDKIEDLVALVALYRPGPMDNIPLYCRRKFGEKVEYLHPKMEPILKETYGIMVYQEQVMEMGKQLAGYSLGGADLLRRAMGKKIKEMMVEQRKIFTKGCLEHSNIDEKTSTAIFDAMEQFANYGFNKSHAVCYAWICYQTAYLKAHYPQEFMATSMTYDMNDVDKLAFFVDNIKKMGIKILRPDINKSFDYFSVEGNDIRYSMAAVKGVGVGVVQSIVKEREANGEFKNITDFIYRVDPKNFNKRMLENLIKAGTFDSLEPNRNKLFENINYILSQIASVNKDKETKQTSLFSLDEIEVKKDDFRLSEAIDWKPLERLNFEKEVIGFFVSAHPLDMYENTLQLSGVKSSVDLQNIKENCKFQVAGIVDNVVEKVSKNNRNYLMVKITDKSGTINLLCFDKEQKKYTYKKNNENPSPQTLSEMQSVFESGSPVLVSVDAKYSDEKLSLFVNHTEILTLNTSLGSDMYIQVNNVDSVRALKKNIASLPPGYTSIHLLIVENGKKVSVVLPEKKGITGERLEAFKVIPDIVFHF